MGNNNIIIENDGDEGECPKIPFGVHYPEPDCVDSWIRTGQLAKLTGVSDSMIRKWAQGGLIPRCKRPREHYMYPDKQAVRAVWEILKAGCQK